jgi:predicted NodU family carbamoyl transferase
MFGLAEITSGRYLSLHPRGAHAPAALRNLGEVLDAVEEETRPRDKHAAFCTRGKSEYALKPERIAALTRVVDASVGAERARVAGVLRKLATRCV